MHSLLPGTALRDRTRLSLLEMIRRGDGVTRAELATTTGYSRSTVGSAVGTLLASGLVIEATVQPKGRGTGRGRPGTTLRPVARGLHVAGIDFSRARIKVAIADELGHEVGRAVLPEASATGASGPELIDSAAELLETLRRQLSIGQISSVVAAVPRPIDHRTGRVHVRSASDVWAGLNPASELAERIGCSVHAENDAVLAAIGELRRGAARPFRDFIYIKVSTGLEASIVLDGRPHHGAHGRSGGIGHSKVPGRTDLCRRCGSRGCLETAVSLEAVRSQIAQTHPRIDADAALAEPDAITERILDEAGRVLGSALAYSCNLLNPAAIIVGGELGSTQPALLRGIAWSLRELTQPDIDDEMKILVATLGDDAELIGTLHHAAELVDHDQHIPAAS